MKAKEYFEKYFTDLESPGVDFVDRVVKFISELSKETICICDARHSRSDSAVDGALKEQNQKFNSVANMIEKKYGRPYLKRNTFIEYWENQFNRRGYK